MFQEERFSLDLLCMGSSAAHLMRVHLLEFRVQLDVPRTGSGTCCNKHGMREKDVFPSGSPLPILWEAPEPVSAAASSLDGPFLHFGLPKRY